MRARVGGRRGEGFWVALKLLEPDVLKAVPVVRAEEGVLVIPVAGARCIDGIGKIWLLRPERMIGVHP